jgi:hypothetical protein
MAMDQDGRVDFARSSPGGDTSPRLTAEAAAQTDGMFEPADMPMLLGNLSDAIAVVTVVQRSLEALEIRAVGDEEVALRYALTLLRAAYNALDIASLHSSE